MAEKGAAKTRDSNIFIENNLCSTELTTLSQPLFADKMKEDAFSATRYGYFSVRI
jgi:hypothetical protein